MADLPAYQLPKETTAAPADRSKYWFGADDDNTGKKDSYKVNLDTLTYLVTGSVVQPLASNTQTLSEVVSAVTVQSQAETINGAANLGPFNHSILSSVIEGPFVDQGSADTGGHAVVFPEGTHSINNVHIRFARGAGIYVKAGAVVTATNVHICHCTGAGVYVERGGKFIGNRCMIEKNALAPDVGQVQCEATGEIELNYCILHHFGQQVLVRADGVARLYRTHLFGFPPYSGNCTFNRCTFTVGQNEDDVLQVTRPDGTVHDLRSGNNVCSIAKGAQPFYPAGAGFGPYAFESLRWVVPANTATTDGYGAYNYWNITTESRADTWVIGTAYRLGDVVEEVGTGDIHYCTSAGTSAGNGTDLAGGSDTGCNWSAYTTTWDKWRERQRRDLAISSPNSMILNNGDPSGLRVWNTPPQFPGDEPYFYNGYAYDSTPSS